MSLFEELENAYQEALTSLGNTGDTDALEAWYGETLGRKGVITLQVRSVGKLPKEDRPAFGKRVNAIKQELEAAYTSRAEAIKRAEMVRDLESSAIDVTLPGRPVTPGQAPWEPGKVTAAMTGWPTSRPSSSSRAPDNCLVAAARTVIQLPGGTISPPCMPSTRRGGRFVYPGYSTVNSTCRSSAGSMTPTRQTSVSASPPLTRKVSGSVTRWNRIT